MLNVALALIPARDDDGQAVFFAQPVAGPAYLVIAALVGMVMLVIGEADRIVNQKKSWESMPVSMDITISNSMLMTASQVRPSTAQAFSR